MRYILYARKSSESEDRQVQSIEDQRRILRAFAQERAFEITQEIEESRSAKDPGARPGFDQMLKNIEQGKAEGILCWNVNRLSRNPIDSGRLAWLLQQGVLQIIQTPEKPYLPTDNVLIFSVETGMANQYILDLKKAVRRGTESKLAKGWFPHRAPEGYLNNLRDHTIESDPERFALLQRAWRLLLTGTHTPSRVTTVLNEEWGYRTRETARGGAKKLSRSAGYRLFSNPFYAGYFEHGSQVYKGAHLPMLTLTEFEEVQQRLRGQIGRAHYHKREFAYAGLIHCGRCGRSVTAEMQPGRHGRGHWIYYHCNNGSGECSKRCIREDVLEKKINGCLEQVTITPEFKEIVRDSLEVWLTKEFGSQETQYGQQLRAMEAGERMLNELVEMRLRLLLTDEQYRTKQQELTATVSRLRLEVGRLQERLDHTRAVVGHALDFRVHAQEQFLIGDLAKRREIARSLGVRYVFDEGTVFIELSPLLVPMQHPQPGAAQLQTGAAQPGSPLKLPESPLKTAVIEPLKIGSGSTKKTDICLSVPAGWTGGTEIEPWHTVFRSVWEGDISFAPSSLV